jgi:hypothetical protein
MDLRLTAKSETFSPRQLQVWVELVDGQVGVPVFGDCTMSLEEADEKKAQSDYDVTVASIAQDEEQYIAYTALNHQANSKVHVRKIAHIKAQQAHGAMHAAQMLLARSCELSLASCFWPANLRRSFCSH